MTRPLRSNFPRGSYLWSVRNAQWQALGLSEADCEKPKIAVVNSSSELASAMAVLPNLRLRGIMTIPEPAPDFVAAYAIHTLARALFDALNAAGMGLDTPSMGMSADLDAAISTGSTMVRVATAVFGGAEINHLRWLEK